MADITAQAEALKIARDLLMDEYVETVNQLEQRWMFESKMNWMTKQIPTPYPDLPAPPSIDDILSKAQLLLVFFNSMPTPTPGNVTPSVEPMPQPTPPSMIESNVQ